MQQIKNMATFDVDINTAARAMLAIIMSYPDKDDVAIADLVAPLTADITYMRRRHALGADLNESMARRAYVNHVLFKMFRQDRLAPQIIFHPTEGGVPRPTVEIKEVSLLALRFEPEEPPKRPPGRPPMMTRAEAEALVITSVAMRRKISRRVVEN